MNASKFKRRIATEWLIILILILSSSLIGITFDVFQWFKHNQEAKGFVSAFEKSKYYKYYNGNNHNELNTHMEIPLDPGIDPNLLKEAERRYNVYKNGVKPDWRDVGVFTLVFPLPAYVFIVLIRLTVWSIKIAKIGGGKNGFRK